MSDTTLADISQEQFDAAELTLIDTMRTSYPALDTRRGTVIRDLLIRPAASVYALNAVNVETLANKMSLVTLANDATATADDYNAILANFGVSLNAGTLASGSILITVDTARDYEIGLGMLFADGAGLQYQTTQAYTVTIGATGADIALNSNTDGTYYFILPVTAVAVGTAQNIAQGTALTPVTALYGFVSAEAYSTFSGGKDAETIAAAQQRLPAAVSYRALESPASIEAKLRAEFESGSIGIEAVSTAGYGKRTQLRDKHNPMGFAVGSRVDVYARTYTTPRVVTLQKTGTLSGTNSYVITIDAADAPGFSVIRSISEPEAGIAPELSFGTLTVAGSYAFTESRSATGLTDTAHDIDTANSVIETAYTCYQQSSVLITGVADSSATHVFKVELYAADGIQAIQDYVDDPSVSNVEADYIVRSPLMCMVGARIPVYCSTLNVISADTIAAALVAYINGRSFVTQLTRSELIKVILSTGATRVDLSNTGMTLYGAVRDAAGVVHSMSGDTLDIERVVSPEVLLTPETCVFATETTQLNIEVIAE